MTTLIVKDDSSDARQFLEFVRTLPYVNIVDNDKKENSMEKVKKNVAKTLKKTEQKKDLIPCKDADDMFNKLGI